MGKTYDRIVIGTGGVGSSAAMHLAARGLSVLALDAHAMAHDQGSSHGETRIIRRAYFEHPNYVPMLELSYQLWSDLEQQTGYQLFEQVGLLEIGPADGVVIPGVLASVRAHQLPIEQLDHNEVIVRYPSLRLPEDAVVLLEVDAGYLHVERCVRAHLESAIQLGTDYVADAPVRYLDTSSPNAVTVETERERYSAEAVIVAAGAWSRELLPELPALRVLRKQMNWFRIQQADRSDDLKKMPAFFYELPQGYFYGFPSLDGATIKVAEHSGGDVVDDPSALDRTVDAREIQRVREFVGNYLPWVSGDLAQQIPCMYTMTKDEHFIVDRYQGDPRIVVAAGLSGHGFKFTSALGKLLSEMSTREATSVDVGFLSGGRSTLESR